MTERPLPAATVEEYILNFPPEVKVRLEELRALIRSVAPEATEKMAYGMPAYHFHGPLVYFGAHARHLGFYPTASGIVFWNGLGQPFKTSKGAVQFPHDRHLPLDLIEQVTCTPSACHPKSGAFLAG